MNVLNYSVLCSMLKPNREVGFPKHEIPMKSRCEILNRMMLSDAGICPGSLNSHEKTSNGVRPRRTRSWSDVNRSAFIILFRDLPRDNTGIQC